MLIALDFDNTYTADKTLWDAFVSHAELLGHTVHLVTARRDTTENREIIKESGWTRHVVFTGLRSKLVVAEERGMKVAIWIDDDPRTLVNGH